MVPRGKCSGLQSLGKALFCMASPFHVHKFSLADPAKPLLERSREVGKSQGKCLKLCAESQQLFVLRCDHSLSVLDCASLEVLRSLRKFDGLFLSHGFAVGAAGKVLWGCREMSGFFVQRLQTAKRKLQCVPKRRQSTSLVVSCFDRFSRLAHSQDVSKLATLHLHSLKAIHSRFFGDAYLTVCEELPRAFTVAAVSHDTSLKVLDIRGPIQLLFEFKVDSATYCLNSNSARSKILFGGNNGLLRVCAVQTKAPGTAETRSGKS